MALVPFTARTEGDVALVAGVAKTVVQIVAPTNQRLDVRGFLTTFKGISPTETPILIELMRQADAGTSSAGAPKRDAPGSETLQSTSRKAFTVEPGAGDVLREFFIHPQGGHERVFDVGEIQVEGGGRLGLRITSPQTATCRASISATE